GDCLGRAKAPYCGAAVATGQVSNALTPHRWGNRPSERGQSSPTCGKHDLDAQAVTDVACADSAAMCSDHALGDRKPEAVTAGVAIAGAGYAHEGFEHRSELIFRDTGSVIAHRDAPAAVGMREFDEDCAALRGVADRVPHDIFNCRPEQG